MSSTKICGGADAVFACAGLLSLNFFLSRCCPVILSSGGSAEVVDHIVHTLRIAALFPAGLFPTSGACPRPGFRMGELISSVYVTPDRRPWLSRVTWPPGFH